MCGASESWNSAVVHVNVQRSETAVKYGVNYGRTGLNVKWIDARLEHVLVQRDIKFSLFESY